MLTIFWFVVYMKLQHNEVDFKMTNYIHSGVISYCGKLIWPRVNSLHLAQTYKRSISVTAVSEAHSHDYCKILHYSQPTHVVLFTALIMVALCNRADHYIFILFLLSSFFPRLISAVGDWMLTILLHMVWP